MFPAVNDFNVVVGGIATFAASVGYACARKFIANPSSPIYCDIDLLQPTMMSPKHQKTGSGQEQAEFPNKDSTSTGPLRRFSLKRKRTDEEENTNNDAGYPYNLSMIYPPKKRARTPTTEDKDKTEEEKPVPQVSRESSPIPALQPVKVEEPKEPIEEKTKEETTTPKEPEQQLVVATPPASPKPAAEKLQGSEPRTPSPSFDSQKIVSPLFPKTPFGGISRQATSSAFAAFAGSTSPFAQAASPFASRKSTRSIWALGDADTSTSAPLNPNGESSVLSEEPKEVESDSSKKTSAIEEKEEVPAAKAAVKHVTGEEEEDVELELKSVKLFIKRGEKPFTTGMVGHMKLLSNKTTLDERLLFRREPLWQVTMNVKVTPTVKCTFDGEESTLRIIAMEKIQESKYEPVIYALRPARSCTKQDFADFAKSLIDSPGFKTR